MTNRMIPTPHRYLSCVWRNKQNNFEKFSENRKISCYFWKNVKKRCQNKIPRLGGSIFQVLHSMTNRMVPTPHRYLSCVWRNKQNNFEKFSINRKILSYFWKNVKKRCQNKIPRLGGSIFQVLHSMTNRMVPTPYRYLSCVWRNKQNNFEKFSENRKILCYFWKNGKKRY